MTRMRTAGKALSRRINRGATFRQKIVAVFLPKLLAIHSPTDYEPACADERADVARARSSAG